MLDSWHWLWPGPAVGAARAQLFLPGRVAWGSVPSAEVIHASPTYHSVLLSLPVLLASLVCLWRAVTVSHSLLVLVGMVTQIPGDGRGSLAAKSQCSACPWQGTTGTPVPDPLTDRPQCNPRLGGSPVSCFCLICFSQHGNPLGQQDSTWAWGASHLQHCLQLPFLTPARVFIWDSWSLSRGMGTSSSSFQGCLHSLWVCLSVVICKVSTQPFEATKVQTS